MQELQAFFDYIAQYIELNDAETEAIAKHLSVEKKKAGTVLLREGQKARVSYFNLKGCVRQFYLVDGTEKTTAFYLESQFISSMRSFIHGTPSDHYLECLEDCELVPISSGLESELLESFPKMERFARMVLEEELGNYQAMLSNQISLKPEERYLELAENRKDLLQRVSLKHLATYLGLSPESLSRIRKRIAKRN